jgi:hypothetical protein
MADEKKPQMTLSDFDDEFEGKGIEGDSGEGAGDDETKKDEKDGEGSDTKAGTGDSGDEGQGGEGDDGAGEGSGEGDEGDEGTGDAGEKKDQGEGEGGEEGDSDDDEDEFEQLNEILGFKPTKQPDFNIDGYATYAREYAEKHSRDAIADYDEKFKQTNPRAYAYMVHLSNGGSDEQFFGIVGEDYSEWEMKDDDKETAKRIISTALREKGMPDNMIRRSLGASEDEDKLIDDAKQFQTDKKAAMERWQKDQETEFERVKTEQKRVADEMLDSLSESLLRQGRLNNIIIPEADKKEFYQHIVKNVVFDGESFYMVNPITAENIGSSLESEYFRYKKGDLDELIKRKAKTESTKSLRLKKKKIADSKKKGEGEAGEVKDGMPAPLGSI